MVRLFRGYSPMAQKIAGLAGAMLCSAAMHEICKFRSSFVFLSFLVSGFQQVNQLGSNGNIYVRCILVPKSALVAVTKVDWTFATTKMFMGQGLGIVMETLFRKLTGRKVSHARLNMSNSIVVYLLPIVWLGRWTLGTVMASGSLAWVGKAMCRSLVRRWTAK